VLTIPTHPTKELGAKEKSKFMKTPITIYLAEKIMIKYLGSLGHPMAKALMTSVKNGDSVILEVSPNYYSTWNYSKGR
jgi:hypothetical protein